MGAKKFPYMRIYATFITYIIGQALNTLGASLANGKAAHHAP